MISVLIPTLPSRKESLKRLTKEIDRQLGTYHSEWTVDPNFLMERRQYTGVEVLICEDNKQMTVGAKRNILKKYAKGDYFTFIDDDDRIAPDYFKWVSTASGDVTVFDVIMSENGKQKYEVKYGVEYGRDREKGTIAYRLPNHLMVWDKKFRKIPFPNVNRGEDSAWAMKARQSIKSQTRIDKVLYYYDFNTDTTETQK